MQLVFHHHASTPRCCGAPPLAPRLASAINYGHCFSAARHCRSPLPAQLLVPCRAAPSSPAEQGAASPASAPQAKQTVSMELVAWPALTSAVSGQRLLRRDLSHWLLSSCVFGLAGLQLCWCMPVLAGVWIPCITQARPILPPCRSLHCPPSSRCYGLLPSLRSSKVGPGFRVAGCLPALQPACRPGVPSRQLLSASQASQSESKWCLQVIPQPASPA